MSFGAVRDRLVRQREESVSQLACTFCHRPTSFEALAALGARCPSCFAAYCAMRVLPDPVPKSAVQGAPVGLEWAFRLQWLHKSGAKLTQAQVSSYREALKRLHGEPEEA